MPEDPALAMSIAYSFTNDASGPVQRPSMPGADGSLHAPEAMPTVIDPPSAPVEQADFEMNTREMSAMDLEALGLTSESQQKMARAATPRMDRTEMDIDVSVDEPVTRSRRPSTVPPPTPQSALHPMEEAFARRTAPGGGHPVPGHRHQTVALSEEDIEVVRAATEASMRAQTQPGAAPVPAAKTPAAANKTMPLKVSDVEVIARGTESEPMSVPDIDLEDLSDRSDSSGEIEVDVDADEPPSSLTRPAKRPSVPPPLSGSRTTSRASVPPPTPAGSPGGTPAAGSEMVRPSREGREGMKSSAMEPLHQQPAAMPPQPPPHAAGQPPSHAGAHPPPSPPTSVAKPPAPPPQQKKVVPPGAVAAVVAKEPSRPNPAKQRQWFVDLFDEDYLRTLPFLTPQATQAEAEFVLNAMNLAPGAQVLDLGCGYGRHAMELAARGFHVVGLDLSTPLLVRGGEEAHRRGLTINFVRGDMRELDFETQFDACYCLFSTFGYFDDETNKKTLQNVARALKPGGKLLVEILNRDYVIADLPTRVWWEGDGCVVLEEVELNYFSSRIQVNRSVVFDDGRQLEQEISVRAYSLHEVGKLMHAAGFRVLEVSGGYQMKGRFLGNQSRHIIVLAERKEASGT